MRVNADPRQTAPGTTSPAAPRRRELLVLFCCLGAGFGTLLDSSAVNYAVPSLRSSLHAGTHEIQWFLAVYSLTFGMGLVPAGRLGDSRGRKSPLLAGLGLFLAGAAVSALAPHIGLSIAGRAVQGLGGGVISAQVLGIIQDEFSGRGRVRALSWYGVASSAASFAGPLLAAAALLAAPHAWAWRAVLALNVPFIAATLLVALRYRPRAAGRVADDRRTTRGGLDLPGVAVLGLLVLIVTVPAVDPTLGAHAVWLLLAVPLRLGALIAWEVGYARRGRLPIFVPELVHSRGFVLGNLLAMFWFGANLAKSTVLTLYLLDATGLSPILVAVIFIPGGLARMFASTRSTSAFDRLGPAAIRASLALEFAASAAILATAALARQPTVFAWAALVYMVVSGLGSGITEPILRSVTFEFSPPWARGVAASFFQLVQRLSSTFFVALATGLFLSGGPHGLPVAIGSGTAASFLALLLSLSSPYRRKPPMTHTPASAAPRGGPP